MNKLSDLIPTLPDTTTPPDWKQDAAETSRLPPKAPINLPTFTFLIGGKPQLNFDIAKSLADQSHLVYVEDLNTPIHDAIAAYFFLPITLEVANPSQRDAQMNALEATLTLFSRPSDTLRQMMWRRIEEVKAFSDYQFVIRNATERTFLDYKSASHINLHLNAYTDVSDVLNHLHQTYP